MRESIKGTTRDNVFLFVILALGAGLLVIGIIPPYIEPTVLLGAAFIIAASVGIYMMLATRQVAKNLHERFNEMNDILTSHTNILKEIASSQKEIASSQKEIASSQKETASTLKNIERILTEKS